MSRRSPARVALLTLLASSVVACREPSKEADEEPAPKDAGPSDSAVSSFHTIGFDDAAARLWGRGRSPYVAFGREREEPLRRMVAALSTGSPECGGPSDIDDLAKEAGYRVERWELGGEYYVALLEDPDGPPTAGAYVFRLGPTAGDMGELLIQAPHAFYDRATGTIALRTFFALGGRARGFFTNTQHRHMQADGAKEERDENPADATHQAEHPFSLATVAALETLGGAAVVQIHGFGRSTEIDGMPQAQVVVSAGDRRGSTPVSTRTAAALREVSKLRVARFPEDTKSLGATKNVQRAAMSPDDRGRFLHLELSADTREALQRDTGAAALFAAALVEAGTDRRGEDE